LISKRAAIRCNLGSPEASESKPSQKKKKRDQQTGSKAGSDRPIGMGPSSQQSRSEPSLALEETDTRIRARLARPDRPRLLATATAKELRCNDGVATAPHESEPMRESTRTSQRRSVMAQSAGSQPIDPAQTPIRCIDNRRRLPRARCSHCCGGHGLTHPK
jgi:hypothetical protein